MAIGVTWSNIFVLAGLLATMLAALVGGMSGMVEWRIKALQYQLNDRMIQYQRTVDLIEKRLDKLEHGR